MKSIFEGQPLHLLVLAILLGGVWWVAQFSVMHEGGLWLDTSYLIWIAVGIAVVHQVYVWFVWRMELLHEWVSKNWPQRGFRGYSVGFAVLGLGRLVSITWLAFANRDTLHVPALGSWIVGSGFLLASMYCLYSVYRYFGIDRAVGIDHFVPEARNWPLVNEGIFKYTDNGMYSVGFLLLWVPGFYLGSVAALVVAAFHHAYIWVHYYCTELPDMREIYG